MILLRNLVRLFRHMRWWLSYAFLRLVSLNGRMDGVASFIRGTPAYLIGNTLSAFGAHQGVGINYRGGLRIDNAQGDLANLTVGDRCFVGHDVFVDLVRPIVLQDEVVLSADVMILTHSDVGDRLLQQYCPRREASVALNHGCWLGARAVILPGVTVGEGAVVAAGAVVTTDVAPYTVVGGVPARYIKQVRPGASDR